MVALIGMVLFAVASVFLSYRLLKLASETRALPELLIGLAFFLGGFLANTLYWIPSPDSLLVPLSVLRSTLHSAGCVAIVLAAWRIFRPHQPWAGVISGFVMASLVPYSFWALLVGPGSYYPSASAGPATDRLYLLAYWAGFLGRTVSYGWAGVECLLYQRTLRRRRRIGVIQDPMLVNRIFLWGVSLSSMAVMWSAGTLALLIRSLTGYTPPIGLITPLLCLSSVACMWLAFFPPASYQRWVQARQSSPDPLMETA